MRRPDADRCALEAHVLHQEILRLDTMVKQSIQAMINVKDERGLLEETRQTKELLQALQSKMDGLSQLGPRMTSRAEELEIESHLDKHRKELQENTHQLRRAAVQARKKLAETARNSLLEGGSEDVERRKRLNDQKNLKENAAKTTERLSSLVGKMGERVAQSEQSMDSLVHSSALLSQTHSEYTNQAGHIQTGNKLLSKYERRELTDKILVTIALIFYFAVVYYILQKRVFTKFWFW